jgi:molybdopterin-synthase adenylyltransferase
LSANNNQLLQSVKFFGIIFHLRLSIKQLMNDNQLLRYSRQIMLPQCDMAGQQKLLAARVLIVGAGGLGSPAAMYLAAGGVGHITIYDNDEVDLSNLQRQIAHHTDDVGMDKVISTRNTLKQLNPDVEVTAVKLRLTGEKLDEEVKKAYVVLDCSDNFATRFAINKACVTYRKPLVSGAAIRFEGQVSVFTPSFNDSPCYNCLYKNEGDETQNCATNGVIAPITGIVGSIQALEAMKLIIEVGETLTGRLLLIDGMTMNIKTMRFKKNPGCPTCGNL